MKKILLTAASLTAALGASAWNVATEPSSRSALIEEFTGIHCPNCPDGHRVATSLVNLHPDDLFTIAYHAGSFAKPGVKEPNFITATGTAIHDHFNISSYPSAVVNRRDVGNGVVQGRGSWGPSAREVCKLTSPVNIWTASAYDSATRTFTIDVETYMTSAMENPRLNVFMLQNEILGPQSGGQLGVEYPHRHMFRDRLTDSDFGDPIEQGQQGDYYSRRFTYVLPEEIEGIATDPVNTVFVAFVTEGIDDVVKVGETRPVFEGVELPFSVSTSESPLGVTKNYALGYFELYINNHGGVAVTSAEFEVTLNGATATAEWTGNVAPYTNSLVRVALGNEWNEAVDRENNRYSVRMTKANGRDVETASIRGTFNEIFSYTPRMTVKIKTDLDAADNTWRIIDRHGNTVKEFGPYADGVVAEYVESVELNEGEIYGLEVFDCWGDGVRHPLGSIRLYDADSGSMVAQLKEIDDYGVRQFFRAESRSGLAGIEDGAEPISRSYYDLGGRPVAEPHNGIFIVRTAYADGTTKVEKQIIN